MVNVIRALVLIAAPLLALAAHAAPAIVLIGDEQRGVIMRDLAASEHSEIRRRGDIYELDVLSVGVSLRAPVPGGALIALADTLHSSQIGLVVVDATHGPNSGVREHILIASQARIPMLAVMFTNVGRLYEKAVEETDDLISLEIEDIRKLLDAYGFDAKSVRIFYDVRPAALERAPDATGIAETLHQLSLFQPRRAGTATMKSTSEIWGAVYLLTELESGGPAHALSPKDSLVVWSEGTHSNAVLVSSTSYRPGDFREMPLSMDSPLKAREGSRILLVSGDRVVGLGAVTQIGLSR